MRGLVGTILFAFAEARQRDRAELNAQAAVAEKREALFRAYHARISAAAAAISAHDVTEAQRQLDAAPNELRGWEWRHLLGRLDDSDSLIRPPDQRNPSLLRGPAGLRIGVLTDAGLRITNLDGGEASLFPSPPDGLQGDCAIQTQVGLRIVSWSGTKAFKLYDGNGRQLCRVELPGVGGSRAVVASADGRRLATESFSDGWSGIGVFDAGSGKLTALCKGHPGDVWAFALSNDGKFVASGGDDRTVRIWDASAGSLLAMCLGHTSKVLAVAFNQDGSRLVSTSADGTVRQWAVPTGRDIEPPYDRHVGEVTAATFSPDGEWIASAGTDRPLRVWKSTGRQDVAILHGHRGTVTGIAFDRQGRKLGSVSGGMRFATGDGTVRGWDVDPRAALPVLRGHTSYVYPVAFSPDGRWIASGGWDSKVHLWDAATAELCATFPQPGIVHDLAFGPEGKWFVTATLADNRLRIWDIATARLTKEIESPFRATAFRERSPRRAQAGRHGGPTGKPR